MRRMYERGTKVRLSFSGGPRAPVNMADSTEELNVGGEKEPVGNATFAALYYVIFCATSFCKSLNFFGTSIASLDPETLQLPAFYILSAMFTGACVSQEKLSLDLASRSNVLRMIGKLAYTIVPCWLSGVSSFIQPLE